MKVEKKKIDNMPLQIVLIIIFSLFCVTTIYPFWNIFVKSFTPGEILMTTNITLLPVEPTLQNYTVIFSDPMLINALAVSFSRTVIGTVLNLLVLTLAAYAMSKKDLRGRKIIMVFLLVPMYLGAGMIPGYVNMVDLGLLNKFAVYILPGLFSGFNFLLVTSFISQLPKGFEESAQIDGASHFTIYTRIILPLSKPILATIGLFSAVGHWNSWFDSMLYVNKSSLFTLQFVLQNIIKQNSFEVLAQKAKYGDTAALYKYNFTSESISMATMIFTIIPILLVYPFLQKYFVQGVTLGGIKE